MTKAFAHIRNLTDPTGIADKVAMTHEGMAHFAGTGPAGATCRHCQHWNDGKNRSLKSGAAGIALSGSAPCRKFHELVPGKRRPPVPGHAVACKWFVAYVQQYRG